MRWLLGVLMLVLCLGTPAMAGKVDTLEALQKQAAKLGPSPFDDSPESHAKLLCLCHHGAGVAIVGFVAAYSLPAFPIGTNVNADCWVSTYYNDGVVSSPCEDSLGTTFWELVK